MIEAIIVNPITETLFTGTFMRMFSKTERTKTMRKILFILGILFTVPFVSVNAEAQTLNVEFTFTPQTDPTKSVVGFKLYKEGVPACFTDIATANVISCEIASAAGTFNFTLAALYSDDSESPQSPPFPFTINSADTPPPADMVTQNLSVEFTFTPETDPTRSVIGYKLYKEGTEACATNYTTANSVNCEVTSAAGTFNFTLAALYSDDSESPQSPPFPFTIGSNTEPPPLEAVISPQSTEGEIPYLVYFNAENSTGNIISWDWDFGDGATGEGRISGHTYTVPGNYEVTLTVSDGSNTEHSSMTVKALEGTPAPEPPTAVISTSAAAGPAPLTVTFDGTRSVSPTGSMTSYAWDFGDGSSAAGATATHTYSSAGTYYPQLTVTDNALSDSVSTPVIVSTSAPANEKPVAKIAATPPVGNSPLKVTFDASASYDPDGSISEYHWNFGDGDTAVGNVVQHAYTNPGAFSASLTVRDNMGGSATASKEILCTQESPLNIKVGQIDNVRENWTRVDFDGDFLTPPVVIGALQPMSSAEPIANVRIKDIDSKGFSIRLQEWDYEDGIRENPQSISYMAIEKGTYTLDDGSKVEAGTITGSTTFEQILLEQSYSKTPVILTQVISENETDAVTGRVSNVNQDSFAFKLQEMEATKRPQASEQVSYIAWEPGFGSIPGGLQYETGATPQRVADSWYTLAYQSDFSDQTPMFFAGIQTNAESDTATVGIQYISAAEAQIRVEEELSKDAELRHKAESIGYLLISNRN